MLEVQGALGRLQLRRMGDWTARRAAHASRLAEACRRFPVVRVPAVSRDSIHAYYRFYGFVQAERLAPGWSRQPDLVAENLLEAVERILGRELE